MPNLMSYTNSTTYCLDCYIKSWLKHLSTSAVVPVDGNFLQICSTYLYRTAHTFQSIDRHFAKFHARISYLLVSLPHSNCIYSPKRRNKNPRRDVSINRTLCTDKPRCIQELPDFGPNSLNKVGRSIKALKRCYPTILSRQKLSGNMYMWLELG